MCALFGWLDYNGKIPHKILTKLTQSLANTAEERGTDASGISYIRNGKVVIYKRPKPAHKLRFRVPVGTTAVMGHTRLTTQGNQKFNYNNHPFYGYAGKGFSFAHNGVLYNDAELKKSKNLPNTHIKTDSYVAVQLIEKQGKLDFESLKSMAENVCGSFTFTLLDENNTLYFIKGSSPLYLIHFKKLGLYVYVSTQTIMEKALKSCGLYHYAYSVIAVKSGDILSINRLGSMAHDKFQDSALDWFEYPFHTSRRDEDDTQLDTILEMCNCFGVEPDTIWELLDYGYSYDEIEAFLMEPSALQEELHLIGEI